MSLVATNTQQERTYTAVDYVLTAIYASLSVFSAGMAINLPAVAWFFVYFVLAGTCFSFFVQRLFPDSPLVKLDGILYVGVGVAAVVFQRDFNHLVPDSPFVEQLVIAGALCWLLALGSFFTWRDGTLLFQAVPGIALFGLVGVFDTYRHATVMFFGFLLCLATMFARAHRRAMLQQATESGFQASREGEARIVAILNGPWRWMAGPEWALASALAIVLISSLGAPFLRSSLKGVSGFVRVPQQVLRSPVAAGSALGSNNRGPMSIGVGPHGPLSDKIVMYATLDQPRFLRVRTYDQYVSRGWDSSMDGFGSAAQNSDTLTPRQESIQEIKNPAEHHFTVQLEDSLGGALPAPGEITSITDKPGNLSQRRDGTLVFNGELSNSYIPISGSYVTSNDLPSGAPTSLPRSMANYESRNGITAKVAQLVEDVTAGKSNDYERALAIKEAIASRVKYDLQAPRTPDSSDPVEYFLFDSKVGYCDLFASSMTLMARSAGIPARYVIGYYPFQMERDKGAFIIRGQDFHAWSELYFEGVGWVPFDATEGADEVPGHGPGDATDKTPWYEQEWLKQAIDYSIILLCLAGATLLFVRSQRKARESSYTRTALGREYSRFVKVLQKSSGKRRRPAQTPNEYLEMVRPALGGSQEKASLLNSRFVTALYSPNETDDELLNELRTEIGKLRSELPKARKGH